MFKKSPAHLHIVENLIVKFDYFLTKFEFCGHNKLWSWFVAAILHVSEILNKLPVHPHIVGNVIVRFG